MTSVQPPVDVEVQQEDQENVNGGPPVYKNAQQDQHDQENHSVSENGGYGNNNEPPALAQITAGLCAAEGLDMRSPTDESLLTIGHPV